MWDSDMSHDGSARNTEGCWTCRVRRKKCDKHVPECHACSTLLITCHYSQEKPQWADGGEKQQEMAEQLKREVRDKAPYRRSLAYAKALDEPLSDAVAPDMVGNGPKDLDIGGSPTNLSKNSIELFPRPEPGNTKHSIQTFPGAPFMASASPHASSRYPPFTGEDMNRATNWTGLDRGFIVCYLEFYFPFLFPFYQPSMLDRGRAWVIDFITDSQAMEQTTLSLSSYFFSLALETTKSSHETCKQVSWEKLLRQIHSTFGLLQEELQCLTTEAVPEYLPRTVQIMGCVLLLQRFEISVRSFENCQAHLTAAIELFKQALDSTGMAFDPAMPASKFESILHKLRDHQPWPRHFQTFQAPSSEQMGFRFFSALLLVDDIVASTALGEEPRLYQYHESLLGNCQLPAGNDKKAPIRLDSVVGCQNWAMVAVAQISALDAWKKRQKVAGDLDMMELVLRATTIKSTLAANLARAEVAPSPVSADRNNPWDIFTPCNGQPSILATQSLLVTRIWAHAAAIYLSTVVSGWQPASSEVRHHVARIIELLSQRTLSLAMLRTIAWPFCVAGCLARPEQEQLLRSIVEGLQPLGLLGPVGKAFEIIENVWRNRQSLDSTTWDLAACFKSYGHLVLLV